MRLRIAFLALSSLTACGTLDQSSSTTCSLASYSQTSSGSEIGIAVTSLGGISVAQSFTSSSGGTAINALAKLKRVGSFSAGSHTLTATIETDNNGVPSTTAVATSATVDPSTISTNFSFYTFTFSSSTALTAGQKYWLRIKASYAVNDSNYISWSAYDGQALGYTVNGTYYGAAYETSTINTFSTSAIGAFRFLSFSIGC